MFLKYVSALAIIALAGGEASAENYNVIVLQDVTGLGSSQAYGINASGQSVGSSYAGSGNDAVLWSSNGVGTVLHDVGGHGNSSARGINASGLSVGFSEPEHAKRRVFGGF